MAIWRTLVAAALPLLLCISVAAAQTEQRIALVIGNGDYLSVGKLKNPANDATAMAAMLRHVGFDVIERENAPRRAMIQAVRSFAEKLSPGGIGLLYYAGHGIQAQGANYLVPVDASLAVEDDLKYETLDLQDILNKLDQARVRLSIVIVDACRDNPFRSFRSGTSGLALINPPTGTVIAYATAPGKVAADGNGDHSIFTSELLKAMSKPDKLLDVFANVTDAVERQTGNGQTPWINSSFRGDFYFTGPTTVNVAPAPDATAVGTFPEIVFWQSIERSTNPADFDAYLKQFPQGNFVALARIRLASLATHPVAAQPPTASDPRPADVKGPNAPLPKQKLVAAESADTKKLPLAVAPTSPDRPRMQPARQSPSPPVSVANNAQPPAPELNPSLAVPPHDTQAATVPPTQEAMVRSPPVAAGQAGAGEPTQPAPAAGPALKPSPSKPTRYCRIPSFTGMDTGAGAYATIRVANTGERCGIRVMLKSPWSRPFDSLSLSKLPSHGSVAIEGSAFYYTPSPSYVGSDDFAIVSSPWGSVRAAVTVLPPEGCFREGVQNLANCQ